MLSKYRKWAAKRPINLTWDQRSQSGSSMCREAYIRYLVSIRNLVNLPYINKFCLTFCPSGPIAIQFELHLCHSPQQIPNSEQQGLIFGPFQSKKTLIQFALQRSIKQSKIQTYAKIILRYTMIFMEKWHNYMALTFVLNSFIFLVVRTQICVNFR